MTDNYFRTDVSGKTIHRHPLKIILNPVLRFLQFYTRRPYVIVSLCTVDGGKYVFHRFAFKPMKY